MIIIIIDRNIYYVENRKSVNGDDHKDGTDRNDQNDIFNQYLIIVLIDRWYIDLHLQEVSKYCEHENIA